MIIDLPALSWFYQPGGAVFTNTYTGSLGTDPLHGFIDRDLFVFRVYVDRSADEPLLKAECHIERCSKEGIKTSEPQEKALCVSEENLKAVNEWLDEQYLKYKKE